MPPTPGSSTLLGRSNKIDPYYLITRVSSSHLYWQQKLIRLQDLLGDLRVDVNSIVPPESPYVYRGSGDSWDEEELLRAFTLAGAISLSTEGMYHTAPLFGLSAVSEPRGLNTSPTTGATSLGPYGTITAVRVTKVGLLHRKDDTVGSGRRAINRKWREWCVLLTGSHLLFFRDPSWAASIQAVLASGKRHATQPTTPQPDEYVSVKGCVAVFDRSYSKVCAASLRGPQHY